MAKNDLTNFDPDVFAQLDTAMWQSYYKHNFLRLFVQLVELCYTYCKPNIFITVLTAYHSAAAAIIFRKSKGKEKLPQIKWHLMKFYKLISDHNVVAFDYTMAADLELRWWLVDRYPDKYKISRATALADSMAVIFNCSSHSLKQYGVKREAAMILIGRHHSDVTFIPDWPKIESLLHEAYRDLYQATRK